MNTFKLQLGAARVDPPRLVLKVESGGGAFVYEKLISPRSPLPISKFQVCKITNTGKKLRFSKFSGDNF